MPKTRIRLRGKPTRISHRNADFFENCTPPYIQTYQDRKTPLKTAFARDFFAADFCSSQILLKKLTNDCGIWEKTLDLLLMENSSDYSKKYCSLVQVLLIQLPTIVDVRPLDNSLLYRSSRATLYTHSLHVARSITDRSLNERHC